MRTLPPSKVCDSVPAASVSDVEAVLLDDPHSPAKYWEAISFGRVQAGRATLTVREVRLVGVSAGLVHV